MRIGGAAGLDPGSHPRVARLIEPSNLERSLELVRNLDRGTEPRPGRRSILDGSLLLRPESRSNLDQRAEDLGQEAIDSRSLPTRRPQSRSNFDPSAEHRRERRSSRDRGPEHRAQGRSSRDRGGARGRGSRSSVDSAPRRSHWPRSTVSQSRSQVQGLQTRNDPLAPRCRRLGSRRDRGCEDFIE